MTDERIVPSSGGGLAMSVVVCTHSRVVVLGECLEALLHQSVPHDCYEIVVVDNASDDGTSDLVKELAQKHEFLHYALEERKGLSNARNRGIAESKGEIVAFIDDDAVANRYLVESHLSAHACHETVLCVGGRVVPEIRFDVPAWMLRHYADYIALGYEQGPRPVFLDQRPGPVGANISFKRSVFDDYGLFDPNLGRSGERYLANEEEVFLKAIKRKEKSCLYVPDACVAHIANRGRSGRRYLIRRAYDKGISDARSGYSCCGANHYLGLPILYKLVRAIGASLQGFVERFLFHGLVMTLVYRYAFLKERRKARKGNKHIDLLLCLSVFTVLDSHVVGG